MTSASLPHLADRADIVKWADRVDARTEFPRLVRGLISATNDSVAELQMRAAEGAGVPGYGGLSDALLATPFVPQGPTVWELGVGADPEAKAQSDYRSRTNDPLGVNRAATTFVFVTPREWRGKEAWAQRRRDEGIWAGVRAFDVDDVEQALELAPALHYRFSETVGRPAMGAQSLGLWWSKFRRASSPELDAELVLAGRADAAADLLRVLQSDPQQTTVSAVSTDEVIAFVASTILSAETEVREELLVRTLIVKDSYTLSSLEDYGGLLVLVPFEDGLAREARLVRNHHVILRVDEDGESDVVLPPIDPVAFQALLVDRGVSVEEAPELARFARRSIERFQRAASAPGVRTAPAWVSRLTTVVARRSWLVGKWSERRSGDLDALSSLIGQPYDEAREGLVTLADGPDPMFLVVGETWAVVSLEDAWRYGQPQLHPADLGAYETLIQNVLGAIDPRLELPVEERWMAAVRGKTALYSSDLRDGVAGVLALLGARGAEVGIGSGTVGGWLRNTMWRLFDRANVDVTGHLWASLTDVLPLLAEAVPDVFLSAVQRGLEGDQPLLGLMFADSEGDALSVSSPHTGLLWALEALAWSPEHFSLTIEQLARLSEADPGGRLSNRPSASLAAVFRSWLPQTSVSLPPRLRVLDGLRTRHPPIAWDLMLSMLPEHHAIGTTSHAPRHRDWKGTAENVTDAEWRESCVAAGLRLVSDAGVDPDRWAQLTARFDDLPDEAYEAAVAAIGDLPTGQLGAQVRAAVWKPLHALVLRHQRYGDAPWSMSHDRTEHLDALQRDLAPSDIAVRVQWLFDDPTPDLPEEAGQEFEAGRYLDLVARRRSEAMAEVIADGGFDGVVALAHATSNPGFVGDAVARAAADDVGRRLLESIDQDDPKLLDAAWGWLNHRGRGDRAWLMATQAEFDGRPVAQARILQVSDDYEAVWNLVARNRPVDDAYWSEFTPYGRGGDFTLVNQAARHLLDHHRHRAALALLHLYGGDTEAGSLLVVEGLEALILDPTETPDRFRLDAYSIGRLLEAARGSDIDRQRIGQLEWALRPALGFDAHTPVLEEQLATDPSFFVQVLSMVFKPRHSEAQHDVSPEVAENAYSLLHDWAVVPGSTAGADAVDAGALNQWVDEALQLAAEFDRFEIALDQIGNMFANAPYDGDGSWPASQVRDVIERVGRSELDNGFTIGILNSRGVQTRGVGQNGERERDRAAHYRQLAEKVADGSPRTAAALRHVAASYDDDARRFDEQAERFNEGLGF